MIKKSFVFNNKYSGQTIVPIATWRLFLIFLLNLLYGIEATLLLYKYEDYKKKFSIIIIIYYVQI